MSDDGRRNLPVPDMLHEVREKIRELQTEEAELRQIIFGNRDCRTGANWVAEVKDVIQQRTDLKELKSQHPDMVAEFTFPVTITQIVLSGIDADTGEIVSARKMRSAAKTGDTPQ